MAAILFIGIITSMTLAQDRIDQPLYTRVVAASITDVEWLPNGDILAVSSRKGVTLYDTNLEAITTINPQSLTSSISWHPLDNRIAVTKYKQIEIWVWDAVSATLELQETVETDHAPILVAWSPDGAKLATIQATLPEQGSYDGLGEITILDTATWQVTQTFPVQYIIDITRPTDDFLTWSPDSSKIAIAANQGEVTVDSYILATTNLNLDIWDVASGQLITIIPDVGAPHVFAILWHPTQNLIAIGSDIATHVYDISLEEFAFSIPMGSDVQSLGWSPDGKYIAGDSAVADMESTLLLGFYSTDGKATSVSWKPDGTALAVGTENGVIQLEDPFLLPGYNVSS